MQPPTGGGVLYDGSQNETRPNPPKIQQLIQYLLHGAPLAGLSRAGVLCVACPLWVRSIGRVRRCVGENDGSRVEKMSKISCFS